MRRKTSNRIFRKVLITSLLSFFMVFNTFAQEKEALESITIDELKNHMYFLASDFLGGRISYEEGYTIATEYCSAQFKSNGLKPAFKDEKGKPSYFQNVPLVKKTFSKDCGISVISNTGTIVLEHEKDFKLPDRVRDFSESELDIVFAGYAIHEPDHDWDDFKNIDIAGKAVIVLMGAPLKGGKAILPEELHNSYQSIPGFQKKFGKLFQGNPAAVIIIPDQKLLKQFPWEMIPSNAGGDQYYYDRPKGENDFTIPIMYAVKNEAAEHFFKGQKYSPKHIETEGIKDYKCYDLKNIKLKSIFKVENEEKINCRNIACIIPGTDDKLKNEYITVGAHLDHVPGPQGKINNGADDNASGSIGVIEVAEAMASNPSKRSTLFILYAAEELGLLGSEHFVNNAPVPIDNIVFNVNLDMIGRSAGEHIKTRSHGVVIHKQFFDGVSELVKEVNTNSVKWPLHFSDGSEIGGDSDHTSYNNKGIPHVFFYSGHHKDLHMPTDDADKIDYEKMQKISQLVYVLTKELGNKETLNFK